ncbi:AMP-binding protein [Streptomyces sp. M19]
MRRRARGPPRGTGASGGRVAVVLPNGPELAVAFFAALTARAQVTLLDPACPAAELGPLLADAAPAAVLTGADAGPVEAGYAAEHRVPVLLLGAAGLTLRRLREEEPRARRAPAPPGRTGHADVHRRHHRGPRARTTPTAP